MSSPFYYCILVVCIFALHVSAQLEPYEIPADLKYLFESDLDTWEPPQEFRQDFPYYLSGYDDENRPIWVIEFGKWDIKKVLDRGGKQQQDFYKFIDQWTYTLLSSMGDRATPDDPVKELMVIFDMEGYSFDQLNSAKAVAFVVRTVRLIFSALRFLNTGYALNTNAVAQGLIHIVRPVFGKEFEKVEVFGTNPAKWIPHVLRKIPRSQLPEWYGGIKDFQPVRVYHHHHHH